MGFCVAALSLHENPIFRPVCVKVIRWQGEKETGELYEILQGHGFIDHKGS